MSRDLTPEKAFIFRIVHRDNIKGVLSDGCHSRSAMVARGGYVDIGNAELIVRRGARQVPIEPGGMLGDYVPFYFTPCSPMLLNIKTGRGVPRQSMSDIVILVSSLHRLAALGLAFVFTDRHAYLKTARFSSDLGDLDWILWRALQTRDFRRDETDKVEKYQAEALVFRRVPPDALLGIVTYDDSAADAVRANAERLGLTIPVAAKPSLYP